MATLVSIDRFFGFIRSDSTVSLRIKPKLVSLDAKFGSYEWVCLGNIVHWSCHISILLMRVSVVLISHIHSPTVLHDSAILPSLDAKLGPSDVSSYHP